MVQERNLTKRTEMFDLRHPSESRHYGNRELLDAKKMAVPEFSFRRISQLLPPRLTDTNEAQLICTRGLEIFASTIRVSPL